MAFGNKNSNPCKRYTYGAKEPVQNKGSAFDQFWYANQYRNDMVRAEQNRREQFRFARASLNSEIHELETKIAVLVNEQKGIREQIKKDNQLQRRKTKADQTTSSKLSILKTDIKILSDKLKTIKKSMKNDPALKKSSKEIDELHNEETTIIYNKWISKGAHWGTLGPIRQIMLGPTQKKALESPRFHRYQGIGSLSIQIQKQQPLSVQRLFTGTDTRVQVTKEVVKVHTGVEKERYYLHFRVNCKQNTWVKIPFAYHRPLPTNADIKYVEICCYNCGTHKKWEVQFIVSQTSWDTITPDTTGRVTIDVGHRKVPDGLQIAVWQGSDGKSGSIIIPNDRMARWVKVEDLQSIRAENFNAILNNFKTWLEEKQMVEQLMSASGLIPDWLIEKTKHMSKWTSQSQKKLAIIVNHWRDNRFAGDEIVFDWLESWRKQDKHLYDWQEAQRQQNIRWRDYFFRQEILNLRKSYAKIGIEDVDWSELQKKRAPEELDVINNTNRNIASKGRFLQLVQETGAYVKLNAKNSSKQCNACKGICNLDGSQMHTCEHCGNYWDRDINACINLMNNWIASEPVLELK